MNMTPFAPPLAVSRLRRAFDLKSRWWLLVLAFVGGGIFEVVDNILGLRQLNFESSAPAFMKVTKEVAILWLLLGMGRKGGWPRLSIFGVAITYVVLVSALPLLLEPPMTSHGQAGLIYYIASVCMLLMICAVYSPGADEHFAQHFVLPVILVTFLTQLLEIALAPTSLYHEPNLFGLDRRAGIAVIPTTAGLLGVVGAATLRGVPRLLSLAVVGLASSSISLICLAVIWISRFKRPIYALIALPVIGSAATFAIASRAGLETSVTTRLDILADTIQQIALVGPSPVGALSTAKSVSIAPFDSYIVDSMYLETLHNFGLIPGTILLAALFMTIYRRVGGLATLVFALVGVGYLLLEAWIVWLALLFALPRPVASAKPNRPLP